MSLIDTLARGGGLRVVASLAAEAAGLLPPVARKSSRSLTSLGIAELRKRFPLQTAGKAGYELARAVWKRAARGAESVARQRSRGIPTAPGEPPGEPAPRPRGRSGADGVIQFRAEFVSPRGVARWRTFTMRGRADTPDDVLRAEANRALGGELSESRRQRYDRGYIAGESAAANVVVIAFFPD